jgi:hypothetical protein
MPKPRRAEAIRRASTTAVGPARSQWSARQLSSANLWRDRVAVRLQQKAEMNPQTAETATSRRPSAKATPRANKCRPTVSTAELSPIEVLAEHTCPKAYRSLTRIVAEVTDDSTAD